MNDALEIATLGRLVEKGAIRAGVRNDYLIRRLETARWIAPGKRQAEWVLQADAGGAVIGRLTKLLPGWTDDFAFLRAIKRDPFDATDIEALPTLRRQIEVTASRINRRNWNAAAGLGPKHRAKVTADCILTKDWVLRFRPNRGLIGVRSADCVDMFAMAQQWSECTIPERAWASIDRLAGVPPRTVVTCENLGAYVDFPAPDSMLVVYSPGADIEAAASLLRMLPGTPWMHFGDYDQEGIGIANRLAIQTGRTLRLFVPSFAEEYLDDAATRPVKTTWKTTIGIPLLSKLQARKRRMFQEVLMLDSRLPTEVIIAAG